MNQSSRDNTLLGLRPSPGPGRGAVSTKSSQDKRYKRSLPGSTVRREGSPISGGVFGFPSLSLSDGLQEQDGPGWNVGIVRHGTLPLVGTVSRTVSRLDTHVPEKLPNEFTALGPVIIQGFC